MIESHKFSIIGKGKSTNEDASIVGISVRKIHYFAIADGIGGKPGGAVASHQAIETVDKVFQNTERVAFSELFEEITKRLDDISKTTEFTDLATTLTLIALNEDGAGSIAHVGDCRAYLLSHNSITVATKDQTELQRLLEAGILNEKSSKRYSRRHVLLSALSPKKEYVLQKVSFKLDSGDRMIIASDGFYNIISVEEIREYSIKFGNLKDFKETLQKRAEAIGQTDDCSVIFIEFRKESDSSSSSTVKTSHEEAVQLSMFEHSKDLDTE